jgi:glycosyltransferase involved in cell wall biosynthesis
MKVCCLYHRNFQNFPRARKQMDSLASQEYVEVEAIAPQPGDSAKTETNGDLTIRHYRPPVTLPNKHVLKILNVPLAMLTLLLRSHRVDADIYHCYGVYSLCIGVVLALVSGSDVTYDAPEDYGLQVQIGFPGVVGRVLRYIPLILEAITTRYPSVVFTVNSKNGLPADRLRRYNSETYTLENVPRPDEFDRESSENPLEAYSDRKILVYVGGLSADKGGDAMIECMRTVVASHPESLLVVIGGADDAYMDHLQSKIDRYGLEDNVRLLGVIDYDTVPAYLDNADIGLQLYQHGPWNSQSMASSTIFRHMGFGLPLVVTDLPGMGTQIRNYECGLTAPPTDHKAIGDQIIRLLEDEELARELGERGRELVETRYNWDVESENFLAKMPIETDVSAEEDHV